MKSDTIIILALIALIWWLLGRGLMARPQRPKSPFANLKPDPPELYEVDLSKSQEKTA